MSAGDANARIHLDLQDDATPKLERHMEAFRDYENRLSRTGTSLQGFANLGRVAFTTLVRMEIAMNAVQNAQDRVMIAQDRLNRAIRDYGAGSEQASQAQKELEISTRSLEIAKGRLIIREAFMIATVLPELIRGFRGLIGWLNRTTTATTALNVATAIRNVLLSPAGLVTVGAALGAGALIGAASTGAFNRPQAAGGINVYGDLNVRADNPVGLSLALRNDQYLRQERK